jgi:hypothetical protein
LHVCRISFFKPVEEWIIFGLDLEKGGNVGFASKAIQVLPLSILTKLR